MFFHSFTDAGTDAAGVVVLLKYPYPREVSEPVQYDSIRVHAQMGQVIVDSDNLRLSVSALQLCILNCRCINLSLKADCRYIFK